ncbi:MAG: hypothetical protein Q7S33_01295 [Nanoarchaeota archaeon]|nr:hypothetical protein [Nanoarchaeota archaeon]
MVKEIGKYNLEGYYLLNGQRGEQRGNIIQYSDGKVIGDIYDLNSGDINPTQQLALGFYSADEQVFDFLKIAKFSQSIYPVMWYLTKQNDFNKKDLSGQYGGKWGLIGDLEAIVRINLIKEIAIHTKEDNTFKELSVAPMKQFHDTCRDYILENGQDGAISFTKI